jgi:photosystem II stability/assembly factor-like uncharacterized protein
MNKRIIKRAAIIVGALVVAAIGFQSPTSAAIDAKLLAGMKARAIGPAATSGRIAAIDAVVSDPNTIYAGTATGGVWKTKNGGLTWDPIFDDQDYASIGAVTIYQASPDIVWVGTGEGNTRNSTSIGGGIYKTVDGGKSWTKMGLEGTERINRIALHPSNPDIAYVAALGPLWGDGEDRGVYKTSDGGETWEKLLYVDQTTGATDVKMDPVDPNKLYAAMWQFRRWPYNFESGGPGSGLYVSKDGGKSWTQKTEEDGLPKGELGRMVIAIAQSQPKTVYALVEAKKSALLRSDDGGETWRTVNTHFNIANRPFYYTEILVDPEDPDTLYNIFTFVSRSIDGGKKFDRLASVACCATSNTLHIDNHSLWINPADPTHLILGNDGGIGISRDRGATFRFVQNLPLSQFYHISVDNDQPYNIYGGLQDNGSWRGPSEVWNSGGIRSVHWQEIGFGDGFDAFADPEDPMRGYAMSQGGFLFRWNLRNGEGEMIRPAASGPEIELRFNWNSGIAQDPFNAATIYYGSQFVHKSSDRGDTWTTISDDLTTNNPDWQIYKESGGLTPDVTAAENYTSIVAIAPSAVQEGVIWVGTDDGRIHVTQDGGQTWNSLEERVRGVPKNTWVPHIEPSPHDASVAYIVFDNHRRGDMNSYVYKVENFGRKWTSLASDVVKGYALSIQQDHVDPSLLFLGTELGLFVSINGGAEWFKWTAGVPTVSVMDLAIQARESDLVLGTHGRSVFVIDDYSALRGLGEADFEQRLKLLSVTDGLQYNSSRAPSTRFWGNGAFAGPNPPRGVVLTVMASGDDLEHPDADAERSRKIARRTATEEPEKDEKPNGKPGKATVEVRDASGEVIRTFKTTLKQGVNRIVWGFQADGARPMPAATPPSSDTLPPGFEVPPGTYKLTVKFDGQELEAEARITADPRTGTDQADLESQFAVAMHLRDMSNAASNSVHRIIEAKKDVAAIKGLANKAMKRQKADRAKEVEPPAAATEEPEEHKDPLKAIVEKAGELEKRLDELELNFRVKPETKGFVFNDDKVANKIGLAFFHVAFRYGAPSTTSLAYVTAAEESLAPALEEVNAFFVGDIAEFRTMVEAAGLNLLPVSEPVAMPGAD